MEELRSLKITNYCKTQTKILKIPFEWTITNFSFYKGLNGYALKSSTFSCLAEDDTKWFLEIYPSGVDKECKKHVSVYIFPILNGRKEIVAKVKFSIINSLSRNVYYELSLDIAQIGESGWGWDRFIKTDTLLNDTTGLLLNDTLTIRCEVSVLMKYFNTSGNALTPTTPVCCSMKDDYHSLFQNELLSDIILSAQGKEFKAHKCVLAARSSYFAAMFTIEMKEKYQDVIEISDVDANVLHELLYFIYTGSVRDFRHLQIAVNLFVAADKFLLCGLKKMCEVVLCKNITESNVLYFLTFGHKHGAIQLKMAAIDFIHNHISALMKTKAWIVLMLRYPYLLNEVLEYNLQQAQNK